MSNFAQPAKKLGESGIGNALAPTGGMGLVLTDDGKIPYGVAFVNTSGLARRIEEGETVVSWPGGAAFSDVETVTHHLGSVPSVVLWVSFANSGLNTYPVGTTRAYGTTSFEIQLATVDAQNPLVTATSTVRWIAIG